MTAAEVNTITSRYGWTAHESDGKILLKNCKGHDVCFIEQKGQRYSFYDTLGDKILGGINKLESSICKLLEVYYFCTKINNP